MTTTQETNPETTTYTFYTVQAHIDGIWQCPGDQTYEWTVQTLEAARQLRAHAVSLGHARVSTRIVSDEGGTTIEGDPSDDNSLANSPQLISLDNGNSYDHIDNVSDERLAEYADAIYAALPREANEAAHHYIESDDDRDFIRYALCQIDHALVIG